MARGDQYAELQQLFRPHIESFNHFLDDGLEKILESIRPAVIKDPNTKKKLNIQFVSGKISVPKREKMGRALFPHECRQAKLSYCGELKIDVSFQVDQGVVVNETINFGDIPIMLMSKRCHLNGLNPKDLIIHKEEATEMGGYFICNGLERLVRLLIMQKRNYPLGVVRAAHRNRGPGYSDKAIVIRCVRPDQSSVTLRLYYLQNESARLGFWIRGREFLLPVGILLKAFVDTNDHEIFTSLTCCYNDAHKREKGVIATQLLGERAQIILAEARDLSLLTRLQCLTHIGEFFKPVFGGLEDESLETVGEAVLKDYIFVHLDNNYDKFNLLIFMLQKLYALVDQTAAPDNLDALQFQEVLLPGDLISRVLRDKLQDWLNKSRRLLMSEFEKNEKFSFNIVSDIKKIISRNSTSVGRAVESMMKIGRCSKGLDLQQSEGMTISAERLNFYRFISHFRAVHRGGAFAKMRITSVRKLLPESWGFLCPVHTPDGEPCGLLNHMTSTCRISSFYDSNGKVKDFQKTKFTIMSILVGMGMIPLMPNIDQAGLPEFFNVLLDGCVVGYIASSLVERAVNHLRTLKISSLSEIPDDLEVGYVPLSFSGMYPGLYLFTNPARFIRPVKNISHSSGGTDSIELIGPFEQAFMEIKCPDGGDGGRGELFPATHEEIDPTNILSVVASLTPYSDHNQSPRNMYQCQMAKQTMAFSSQNLKFRSDNKSYHLHTPQTPIVRTETYSKYCMDEFPTGTNAIVAVLAYTGYDMEDAMILNKSSVERGLCRGHIYKTQTVDLEKKFDKNERFERGVTRRNLIDTIDFDGLPCPGQKIQPNDPLFCSKNNLTLDVKVTHSKETDTVIVDSVSIDSTNAKKGDNRGIKKANIRTRQIRNPVIGDKFSSRHGQKGVLSVLYPDEDMPFSAESGMRPDLIINPHAFPSRMTIGMLFESIAAKAGSLRGQFMDATTFRSVKKESDGAEKLSLDDELGSMLASYGFNYYGKEVMYSGVFGTELTFEIFMGPVYYQRLRHMVGDKFQARSTGTIDPITKQPVGGRKRGGGIRFGEMERDSVLAHGAAYLLHDRLHSCSDYHIAHVCTLCGSLLTTTPVQTPKKKLREMHGLPPARARKEYTCYACKTGKGIETVAMPYVFRYLSVELASMNIKMELQLSENH